MDVRRWADRGRRAWLAGGASVAVGAVAALLIAGPGLAADDAGVVVVPAPPGEAAATAVEVGSVVRVGSASAQAGPDGSEADSSASATALEVHSGPVHEEVGGSQRGTGSSRHGELAGAQHEDVGYARVLPWDASVGDRTRSESSAGLLEIMAKGLFRLDVARGNAVAEHDGKDATGSSSSDGAALSALDRVEVGVLHAESNSDGSGRTYVARLNDVEVGSDGELSECPLSLPFDIDIDVSVNCVASTGGAGGGGSGSGSSSVQSQTAGVALTSGSPLEGDGQVLAASSSSGRSGQGSVIATAASPTPSPSPSPASNDVAAAAVSGDDRGSVSDGGLARTGASPLHLGAAGVALLALGNVLLAARRLAALQPLPVRVHPDQSLRKLR